MENNRRNSEPNTNEDRPVETDTGKIVRRHLANEEDEITDDDIRNVRIAVVDDEPITTGAEAKARFIDENEKGEDEDEIADETDTKDKPVTPWDVLDNK